MNRHAFHNPLPRSAFQTTEGAREGVRGRGEGVPEGEGRAGRRPFFPGGGRNLAEVRVYPGRFRTE